MTIGQNEFGEIISQVLTDNTAQSVLNHLKALESNRAHVRTRWVWELLQNARDASAGSRGRLVASIVQSDNEIIFQHNGKNFTLEEIAHLIYHGSTKVESEEAIGQYGSGFLTTHLLSPEINIAGEIDDGRRFDFRLKREIGSVSELSDSMKLASGDFENSLGRAIYTGDFTTTFRYPLRDDAVEVVEDGISKLKQCAPFVVAFNQQFSKITIKSPESWAEFEVVERTLLEQGHIELVRVSETNNSCQEVRQYIVISGDKASVAFPMNWDSEGQQVCLPVDDIPKLFLGFPLVGTENFSFPGVINSFNFTPTENRDGVFLWQSPDSTNQENQAVLEESMELLVELLQFSAASGWQDNCRWAEIPVVHPRSWSDDAQLRQSLERMLIQKIRKSPVILNESGEAIVLSGVEIPLADNPESVLHLWDLLVDWQEDNDIWPRRDEAVGWCDALRSWARVTEVDVSSFEEMIDGSKLASIVDDISHDKKSDPRTHRLNLLEDSLKDNTSSIEWLDRLIGFLNNNGLTEAIREYHIVPSQRGFLRALTNLRRDDGIHEELKDIAELLGWQLRGELRDTRLTSLSGGVGSEDWGNEYVAGELTRRLRERANNSPDDAFAKASPQLFTWIVNAEDWDLLVDFPVFARRAETDGLRTAIYLPRNNQANDRPMSPVGAWTEALQPFADLFPPTRILSDDFFAALPDKDIWQAIADRDLVRTEVIISDESEFNKFYPDHPLRQEVEHSTVIPVPMTDVWRKAEIMERVRDSQARARLFWRFLTEWLAPNDEESLEIEESECECGEEHRYYPAAWLEPLRENTWVRTSNDVRTYATAQSLANLLRGDGGDPSVLRGNIAANKLLEALGISYFDLLRAYGATTDEQRKAQDEVLTNILATSLGNVSHLDHARQYIEDLQDDQDLPDILADRRERRKQIQDNQRLGYKVENLVREALEGEGFTVERTGVGSDFSIEYGDLTKLALSKSDRSWLVEVKATRERRVRMSAIQAKTAVSEEDGFLLCVVPVEGAVTDLVLEDVQGNIQFVQDIGPRVAPLCENLDDLIDFRKDITSDGSQGVQLEVEAGAARVSVANSVWECEGFPLAELSSRLK